MEEHLSHEDYIPKFKIARWDKLEKHQHSRQNESRILANFECYDAPVDDLGEGSDFEHVQKKVLEIARLRHDTH